MIPGRNLPVPAPQRPIEPYAPKEQLGLVREGTPWMPPDPDSFDKLLPKTTSVMLPEQPGPRDAKTAYRRVFGLLIQENTERIRLIEAVERCFIAKKGTKKEKAAAMLQLMGIITDHRKEEERRAKEGVIQPFQPPPVSGD